MKTHLLALILVVQVSMIAVHGFSTVSFGSSRARDFCLPQKPQSFGHKSELNMAVFSRFSKRKVSPSGQVKKRASSIPVKPRPLVNLDEETGKYIPAATISHNKQDEEATIAEIQKPSLWTSFKDGVYNVIDGVPSFRKKKAGNSIKNRKIAVAYTDTVETLQKSSPPTSRGIDTNGGPPGQKLMQQYQASLKFSSEDNQPKDLSNGENLYQTDFRKSFESAKDSIYGTIDNITPKKTTQSPTPNTQEKAMATVVLSKPSANKDKFVSKLSAYAQDLKSSNPIKRLKANLAIKAEERNNKRSAAIVKRNEAIDGVKTIIFGFIDTVQVVYESLLNTPTQIERSFAATQSALDETMVQITSAPEKIQRALDDTKKGVEETQRATMEVIDEVKAIPVKVSTSVGEIVSEVQAIPGKVETSVSNTKRSVEQTKEGLQQFVKSVENLTAEAKYLSGLEQRPPPPPPPPKTNEEFAKDVAIGVAKGTASLAGKASVVVAKGTAGMAVSGAKLAWQAAQSEDKNGKSVPAGARDLSISTADMAETPKTIAEIDPSLEAEVVEALRIAEQALATPRAAIATEKQEKRSSRRAAVGPKGIDINEAVQRAKRAAAQAEKDAAELEAMLIERRALKK